MARHTRNSTRNSAKSSANSAQRKLRAVPSESPRRARGVERLLSGRVPSKKAAARRPRKKKPTESMPGDLSWITDVFVAGRKVEREIEFKIRYAERKVKDYCQRRFAELYAATGKRPPSIDYEGKQSHFTFIQTARINMTHEKSEALRELGLPVDEVTELKGLRVNYEAIQRHKLENKLRAALEQMNVSDAVLDEIFEPIVQLKDTFFDRLDAWIARGHPSKSKQDPAQRMLEVIQILQPASQIRNAEAPEMSATECFNLVEKAEIEPSAEEGLEEDLNVA